MATVKSDSAVPKRRGRPPMSARRSLITPAMASDTQASNSELEFTYYVKMYVPDPRTADKYFTYDGTVSRSASLNSGHEFAALLQGLADHIFTHFRVVVPPQSIVIQQIEFVLPNTTDEAQTQPTTV